MLIGVADEVAREPVLPGGVVLRPVTAARDMARIADLQTEVWGFDCSWLAADLVARVVAAPEEITVLVVEAQGRVVCTAWSVYQPGTGFVALLGGTTSADWQGRGLYRAVLAARAVEARARGYRWLHVDASDRSAPILRRHGFRQITTSVHYLWSPAG